MSRTSRHRLSLWLILYSENNAILFILCFEGDLFLEIRTNQSTLVPITESSISEALLLERGKGLKSGRLDEKVIPRWKLVEIFSSYILHGGTLHTRISCNTENEAQGF